MVIFITSSLSFTFGYFVGKSVQPPVVTQTSVIPQDGTEQKNIEPEKKETVEQQQAQETQETKETKETQKKRNYTIQAGAFKDAADADDLKARLDKTGYKAYVTQSEKKHEKLYKVMIGNFAARKEAELLSIKIRESEGLQTFVTFKTEQEDLR